MRHYTVTWLSVDVINIIIIRCLRLNLIREVLNKQNWQNLIQTSGVWFFVLMTFSNYSGLECLCSILKCMVEWSREYYIDPNTTGLNAVYRSETGTSTTEGEVNNIDGGGGAIVIAEVQESQSGLAVIAGRQMRGSFSTLRPEAGTYVEKFRC